ncbi:hypothetical protein DPMN_070582 [Dreissena polymorpha]|uniref:Uncharacterized protein n=1 Tax=Dreissena polymorpha TaxID=45954 RepID=A0A9D3Z390_DREPO|nr:hypothetical protein DPMN_070582 [Dreissena polymorpha]
MTPIYKQELTALVVFLIDISILTFSSQKGPSPLDLARTYCQNYVDPPGFEVKTDNDVIGEEVSATKPLKKETFFSNTKGI